jgi:hypothetical protein
MVPWLPWLFVISEIAGACMVAFSIKPNFEAAIATRVFSFGQNAVPVRFNRGFFRLGLLLMAAGAIAGAFK